MTQAPPQQQYPGPPEGYVLTKQKKPIYKRVWFLVLVGIIVVFAIAKGTGGGNEPAASSSPSSPSSVAGSSAHASKAAAPKAAAPKAAGIGTPVRDGKFEFTVKGVDCSKNVIGEEPLSKTAQGVFCVVSVHVSNIGNEAQMFDASSQKAFDAQKREFSADSSAAMYQGDAAKSFLEQLNPGSAVDGQFVYDVPTGTKLTQLELHDSPFSGGVKVSLA